MYIIKLKHDRFAHMAGKSKTPFLMTKEGVDAWIEHHGTLWVEVIEEVKVINNSLHLY